MSKTFKGYNKKDTSGRNMLRIEKRERILGLAISTGCLKPSEKFPGVTEMEIFCPHYDLLEWEINLVKETGWLKTERFYNGYLVTGVKFYDNIKLRIYRKWLYLNGNKTFKHVLKYMYSPLFPALLTMNCGLLTDSGNILLKFNTKNSSTYLLKTWFKNIFDINAEILCNSTKQEIFFNQDETKKLLYLIEPIVKHIPSMHEKFCSISFCEKV